MIAIRSTMTRIQRAAVAAAVIAGAVSQLMVCSEAANAAGRVVSEEQARRLGLQRAWTGHVRVDAARNNVERAILEGDRLTVMTTAGVVQEFDALTGKTLWTAPIGNPDHPSLGPASNDQYVAVINGSTLYVLDQKDGKPVIVRPIGGAPGAAPALAANYVFVPLATGRIEGYPLDDQKKKPWYYQSYGRVMVPPVATPESFVWTTDSGHFYVGRTNEDALSMRFRLETGSEIVAPPAYGSPNVIAATCGGEVFSMNEMTGQRQWKYATGFPVLRAPAVVGNRVFVTSEEPMLHCVDAAKGTAIWEAPQISQFAAATEKHVYGIDDLGALVVLDAATGAEVGRMSLDSSTHALVNDRTDRIYLVSSDGVVQCLHEIGLTQPIYYRPKAAAKPAAGEEKDKPATAPVTKPSDQEPAETEEAAEPADEAAEAEEPAEEEAMPADESEPGGEEDPFSGIE